MYFLKFFSYHLFSSSPMFYKCISTNCYFNSFSRKLLFSNSENYEEGTRNVVSECLGKLALLDPVNILPQLQVRRTETQSLKFESLFIFNWKLPFFFAIVTNIIMPTKTTTSELIMQNVTTRASVTLLF